MGTSNYFTVQLRKLLTDNVTREDGVRQRSHLPRTSVLGPQAEYFFFDDRDDMSIMRAYKRAQAVNKPISVHKPLRHTFGISALFEMSERAKPPVTIVDDLESEDEAS